MTKLNDKQTAILANAVSRADRTVLPLPETIQLKGAALSAVLRSLERRGLVRRSMDHDWTITDAGRAAVAGTGADGARANKEEAADAGGAQPAPFRPGTRQAQLLDLLQRDNGSDIDEMVELTGWQPHSVRAVLTGFRKRGIRLTRTKQGNGVSVYRAALPAATVGATG